MLDAMLLRNLSDSVKDLGIEVNSSDELKNILNELLVVASKGYRRTCCGLRICEDETISEIKKRGFKILHKRIPNRYVISWWAFAEDFGNFIAEILRKFLIKKIKYINIYFTIKNIFNNYWNSKKYMLL